MMENKTISILGCGWLGLPLGEYLVKKGYSVNGSTRTQENFTTIKQKGIFPFQLEITNSEIVGNKLNEFFNSEILIVNFPPQRRDDIEIYHMAQAEMLLCQLKTSPVKKVLFVSSTSVYPETNAEVFETETALPAKPSGKALKAVENILLSQTHFETTIIRFSGLIGYDRVPGRLLEGKTTSENGNAPMNVIHRDDCIRLITQLIQQNVWNEVFNASADYHPTRKEFYTRAAIKNQVKPPVFEDTIPDNYKLINSEKIKKQLNYSFKYADPLDVLNDRVTT